MDDAIPIVVDLGTAFLKVGRSSSMTPEFVLPNTVGRPAVYLNESFSRQKLKDLMISDETTLVCQYLDRTFPMEKGVIKNWEDEKLILDDVVDKKLRIEPADHPILIAEAPLNPLVSRPKLLEVFYETLNFSQLQITPQSLLVLYARGLVTFCLSSWVV
jgi:actin-related protein 2